MEGLDRKSLSFGQLDLGELAWSAGDYIRICKWDKEVYQNNKAALDMTLSPWKRGPFQKKKQDVILRTLISHPRDFANYSTTDGNVFDLTRPFPPFGRGPTNSPRSD